MRVLGSHQLPARAVGALLGQQRVRLFEVRIVVEERGVETAGVRDLVIDLDQRVVAARFLVPHRVELPGIAVAEQLAVRQRIERQRARDLRVDGHRAGREPSLAGGRRRHGGDRRLAEHLAKALVVGEPERPVLHERAAERHAVLVAMEGRRLVAAIEVVLGVHRAVAMELEDGAADLIRARSRDGVDDAARRAAVLRRIRVGEHGELGHRLDAEIRPERVAWRGVGVVVDADAIEPIVVLRRPRAGDGHLHSAARARAAAAADADDAGLQHRELRPVPPVQRQLADRRAAHVVTQRGGQVSTVADCPAT